MRGRVTFLALVLACLCASPVHAWMWEVGDEELAEVTGAGFSSFTLQNEVAKAYFNINASTFTEINSLKMGYYDDGITGLGWDQNWQGVSLGSADTSLICKGLYIEAKFSNMTDPANRRLDHIKLGTPDMTGPISANFVSFSGKVNNVASGVLVDGRRLNLGTRTITSLGGPDAGFSISLERDNGWTVEWGNATITAP